MARYVELECVNEDCEVFGMTWEVYCAYVVYGPDDYELVPVSDEPTGLLGNFKCSECDEDGEEIC